MQLFHCQGIATVGMVADAIAGVMQFAGVLVFMCDVATAKSTFGRVYL